MKTLNITKMLLCLAVMVIMTSSTWATPVVNGALGDSEYDSNTVVGDYSECYFQWGGDYLYVCNDWFKPTTVFPGIGADYNVFTWTGVYNWRLKVNPTSGILQKLVGNNWIDQTAYTSIGGFNKSVNDPDVSHPIWEFKISSAQVDSSPAVKADDAKNPGDSGDPGKNGGWDTVALGFGTAPIITVP